LLVDDRNHGRHIIHAGGSYDSPMLIPSCHGKPERYAKPGYLTGAPGLCPTSGCGHHESVANDEVKAYVWN
jgi:hypothetical protein